ncbi:HAMP domain-containing protein [Stagnimonas aquatica]|uniref:histidine kinase n=1 Tax=Stagnimonas aquatica TaxID=2689987 RepID=A0A3N0V8A0_9GAMM|nr:HAMP domain-containing sensor histidine kinase [Stagnimonas aquatica]ROH89027.1 HAMP domain-containing protein [Stagnimonas aquatica]
MRLYPKLLLWLALNLALIAALFLALPGRAGLGWSLLLTDSARERLLDVGDRLAAELSQAPEADWPAILEHAAAGQNLRYRLEGGPMGRGQPPGGFPQPPPGGLDRPASPGDGTLGLRPQPPRLVSPIDAPPLPLGPRPSLGPEPPAAPGNGPDRARRAEMIELRRARWFGEYRIRIPAWRSGTPGGPLTLSVELADLRSLLGYLGVGDWALFGLLTVLLSALLWWPFIWSITRAVVAVTRATERIADGRFDARVQLRRRDELGQLAEAVNRMAARLDNQLAGQKQFVADVAHEVTSPLARLRIGLGLLEPRLPAAAAEAFADIQDDAQQMSELLDELLLFSRAGLTRDPGTAERLPLAELVAEALEHEDAVDRVQLALPPELAVRGHRALLRRALANLVRNALRYGQPPVELAAAARGDTVLVWLRDRGPGVPPEALARLGEPFYRPDAARSRDSGGTGLGLAIVRRCVEAGEGSVQFRNREGGGFEVELRLRAG